MDSIRQSVLTSMAKVRLITGKPGVGKTYLGCEIAEYELCNINRSLLPHQKILFLTFARNAVARIRQAYLERISYDLTLSDRQKKARQSLFHERVCVNTFAGFYWWLVEAYGRYSYDDWAHQRPWFVGSRRISDHEVVPHQYRGYTFDEIEQAAHSTLNVRGLRKLLSDLYPLIIIDEFQDVHDRLFEIITLLGGKSRLVLLRGPGQCIYQNLKHFEPETVLQKCLQDLHPEQYELVPEDQNKQRYCPEISGFISSLSADDLSPHENWPVRFLAVPRLSQNNRPKELETQAGQLHKGMKGYLKKLHSQARHSLCVLASTNQGAAAIFSRFRRGSTGFNLQPIPASLHFDDLLLLQYGRLLLELLGDHWVSVKRNAHDTRLLAYRLVSFFQHLDASVTEDMDRWHPLVLQLSKMVRQQNPPKEKSPTHKKLRYDLEHVNRLLRSRKDQLPTGTPTTPLTASDAVLLQVILDEFLKSVKSAFNPDYSLNTARASRSFEKFMRQRVIFEKTGISAGVQIMTIHKSKGREFDGVILVLEDNRKALWKRGSLASDSEVEDLYRVAISRAKYAFGLIAYKDSYGAARPAIQRMLPRALFDAEKANS